MGDSQDQTVSIHGGRERQRIKERVTSVKYRSCRSASKITMDLERKRGGSMRTSNMKWPQSHRFIIQNPMNKEYKPVY